MSRTLKYGHVIGSSPICYTKLSMHGAMIDGSPRGSNPLTFRNVGGLVRKEVRVLSAHKYCPSACLGGASSRQGDGGQFESVRGNKK